MQGCRPKFIKVFRVFQIPGRCQVISQSIKPDINNMLRVPRYLNTPIKGCTRNTEIFQAALNESNHFVATRFRLNEIRVFFNEFKPSVGIFIKAQEVAFLFYQFQRTAAIGADVLTVRQLVFRPEGFIRRTIPAFVFRFINITVIKGTLHQILNHSFMSRLCCPDKNIVRYIQTLPQIFKQGYNAVYILDGLHSLCFGSPLNFLTVFVRPGYKKSIVTAQTMKSGQGIGNCRAIRMADMQFSTGIINRGSNIISFLFFIRHE